MSRRDCLMLAVAAAGCGRSERPPDELLPISPGEGWTRSDVRTAPPAEAPDTVRQLGPRRVIHARYSGPGDVELTIYEMGSAVSAFELNQKWRVAENAVHFHHGPYLVVAESGGAGKPRLFAFARLIEQHLKSLQ
ncbi:MAG TPA: hypothetical protein VLE22_07835 [Bryobacteraceae bacterium]|nr:hypothetical protein [Bryobacteraceae bacterium]